MTANRLSQALDDLATEAGSYASYDAVVAATGRRRRRHTVLMAAAAVLVVSLGGGVAAALGGSVPPKPAPEVAAWPEPDAPPRTMPTTGAVGRGAYAFNTCEANACEYYLVTDDGLRYTLPNPGLLSPDGRWLGYGLTYEKYLVRDLTTGTVWTVTNGIGGLVWSTDSRWLLMADGTDPRQKWYLRLDVRTGEQRTSDVPFGFADGVLPSGEVLYTADASHRPAEAPPLLTRYDPATGAKTEIPLAPPGALRLDGESIVEPEEQSNTVLAGPGNTVLVGLYGPDGLTALLEYDLAGGRLLARHAVPPQAGEWFVTGYRPTDGIVLTRCDDAGTDVVLLNPVIGESHVVLTLPGKASVTLAASDR
jgi:hypothetical protein